MKRKLRLFEWLSGWLAISLLLLTGLGCGSHSWHNSMTYDEAEEMAWSYIIDHDIMGVVLPVLPTGSMGPDLHHKHVAVVARIPFEEVEPGQIAVFQKPGYTNPTAHTVEHIYDDGRLKTRGRANTHFDQLVTEGMYIGVVMETFEFRDRRARLGML